MKNKKFTLPFFIIISLIIFTTACKNITDLLQAIERYGYKSSKPLGEKNVPVDQHLLGGYLYNDIPVIISKKDHLTYLITFLATELDKENIEIEAFTNDLERSTYLNLDLGSEYAFMKLNQKLTNSLEIKLVRNSIETYVPEANLRSWLLKNGNEEEFIFEKDQPVDIFYTFSFQKTTPENARAMQAEQLQEKKRKLFAACTDYDTYNGLMTKYTGDPLLQVARENILNNCRTTSDYNIFISRFPGDPLIAEANKRLEELTIYTRDSLNYYSALRQNTIDGFVQCMNECKSVNFKDSAKTKLTILVSAIKEERIEWTWTGGNREDAMKLIFYKIDYTPQMIDAPWYIKHIRDYSIAIPDTKAKETGLAYLDRMAMSNPSRNELLDLYLGKGFLLWSLDRPEQAVEVFKSRINETYDGPAKGNFRQKIKSEYKAIKGNYNIVFPEEKATWKRIRKL